MRSKKRLATLVIASALAASISIGGATYAIFTSSASNTGNTFSAGTVIIDQTRDQGDTVPGPMFYSAAADSTGKFPYDTTKNYPYKPGGEAIGGWVPGDSVTRAMNIYNKGTLDVKINKLRADVNSAGVTSGDAYQQFINKMNIKVMYPATDIVLYEGPLSGLLGKYVDIEPFIISTEPSGPANITFKAMLDKSADNELQGKSFIFDFTFLADQSKNNP